MQGLKYLGNVANRVCIKISFAGLFNNKSSFILFLIINFSLLTPHLLNAAGMVYWTPNGVQLTSRDGGIEGLVDDMKGGAITFSFAGDSVYAIRVDRNGSLPWGLPGKTIDNYSGTQSQPIGVSDGRGGAIAVWQRVPFPQLYYQRIDSLGNKMWGTNAQRVTLSDSAQWWPAICSDGVNGIIIAWQEIRVRARGSDIYAQRIDSNGTRQWGDYGVAVCATDSSQDWPKITCDNIGNCTITWADMRNGNYDVYSQRLTLSGSPAWQANGIAICDTSNSQVPTGIIMGSDTTIVFVWNDQRNGFANRDVYAQNIKINGLPQWATDGIAVCDTINRQSSGQLVSDGNGGAIFCWVDERNGNRSIYAQRVNSFGQRFWSNQGNAICTADSSSSPKIVFDGKSGAIICWQDKRSGNWDIYAQHIDSSGNILWDTNGMLVCNAANYQEVPYMINSDSGRAIIVWDDGRAGSITYGYAQKVGDNIIGIADTERGKLEVSQVVLENNPNPFEYTTVIKFHLLNNEFRLNARSQNSLKIFNCIGQLVKTFNLSFCQRSSNQVIWDGIDNNNIRLPRGVYFCELITDKQNVTKKIILVK